MSRTAYLMMILLVVCGLACTAAAKPKEISDPEEAKADPDFSIQGEYVGVSPGSDKEKIGAQVIALGQGNFRVVVYRGGLPGEGWRRGDDRVTLEGTAAELKGRLPGEEASELTGKIVDGKLTLAHSEKDETVVLKRIERQSPTLGAKPPAGAVVIFDGSNVEKFEPGAESHLLEGGILQSGVTTKAEYNSYKLHLEFRLSWMPEARGQGRSNSGVYIHDCYECQVLDSFGLEGYNNECGGFYKVREPDVNMCFPPLAWQTYDIDFVAPKYEDGKKVANARITVVHNGVVIHENVEMPGGTPGRKGEGPGPRGIHLQGHGNKVMYRNIWLVERK